MPTAAKKPSKKKPSAKAPPPRLLPGQPPGAALPIPGEPPPPLLNYEGRSELLRENPSYLVALDAGAFMWLWRIVESKALHHHLSATSRVAAPEQLLVALHATSAFREAAGTLHKKLDDVSGGRKRVLKRV